MVTADELTQIQRRMAEAGITNAGAYMRKMALNGYILHVDLAPVRELVSLQRRCANNLNQVAVHANTFGVYPEEIAGLQRDYEKLWGRVSDVLTELSVLVESKRTIITRTEQSYGRVPLAGLCRLFISVYVPGAGLPGARASAFPAPHGSEICPDRAAYSAPAIDTHKAQCRWPWPFPPANTQWHWIPRP